MFRFFRFLFRLILWIVEKIIYEFALIAALLSLAYTGNYLERIIGATLSIAAAIQAFAMALYFNEPLSQVITSLRTGIDNAFDGMIKSIGADPQSALVSLALTFILYKIVPIFLSFVRKELRNRKKSDKASLKKQPPQDEKNKTFSQLYSDQPDKPHSTEH